MKIKALKGFKDILPDESGVWQHVESTARKVFHRFGFKEIKVPILEKTDLFARSIGETTDIVEKEMYSFTDRNGASLTMRPEGTASVLRSFIEHSLHAKQPVQKLYTIGPMFRHERPQLGRLRQFHQMSVEVLGAEHPEIDAEVMAMAWMVLTELGLSASLEINSLGCPKCRPDFNASLLEFLDGSQGLCQDCERRRHKNPLRVLDCKNSQCQEYYASAPSILDHLCTDCDIHFQTTQKRLSVINIPYKVNSFMVRGLDYYTRTTFELVTNDLGSQSAIGAGGRYDGLVKQLGGPPLPGIGFAMGMERIVLLLTKTNQEINPDYNDLFLAALGSAAQDTCFALAHSLRKKGLRVLMDYAGRSLKSQMRQAGKNLCRFTLIVGDDELTTGTFTLRDMENHTQENIEIPSDIAAWSNTLFTKIKP